uniref:Uncharacterized protein n=1 Tax=Arundo donax TaxID=35708 RepID=A0A0A9GXB0_ARUDO
MSKLFFFVFLKYMFCFIHCLPISVCFI